MSSSRFAAVLSLAAAFSVGCTPQSAEVTSGSFKAFLAASTSPTLFEEAIDLDGFDDHYTVDCRDPDDVTLLDDPLDICDDLDDVEHERWLEFDGFEVVSSELDPWRGEAIITSEGDLQITFHNRLPGGRDMRFAIAIDPNFQPKRCTLNDAGESVSEPVDGDWIANWSGDAEEGGSLYYLNAGAYQFNPSDAAQIWSLPDKWLAGITVAKFAEEDFYVRTVRYGTPTAYAAYELDGVELSADDLFYEAMPAGTDPKTDAGFQDLIEKVNTIKGEITDEFALVNAGDDVSMRVHDNAWRVPDGTAPGLDGWAELHYNWIRFDQDRADLAVGEPASGEFHLVLDASESQSRLLISGEFNVDKIRKDRWVAEDIAADKLEEYGNTLCGAETPAAE